MNGELDQVLADATLSAAGAVAVAGGVVVTLAAATLSAAAMRARHPTPTVTYRDRRGGTRTYTG